MVALPLSYGGAERRAMSDRVIDDTSWCRGYTAALGALAPWEEDTVFDAVVNACGAPEALIVQARKDGAMRWSGLSGYVRRRAATTGKATP